MNRLKTALLFSVAFSIIYGIIEFFIWDSRFADFPFYLQDKIPFPVYFFALWIIFIAFSFYLTRNYLLAASSLFFTVFLEDLFYYLTQWLYTGVYPFPVIWYNAMPLITSLKLATPIFFNLPFLYIVGIALSFLFLLLYINIKRDRRR